jgi:hypothetical protein
MDHANNILCILLDWDTLFHHLSNSSSKTPCQPVMGSYLVWRPK